MARVGSIAPKRGRLEPRPDAPTPAAERTQKEGKKKKEPRRRNAAWKTLMGLMGEFHAVENTEQAPEHWRGSQWGRGCGSGA